MYLAVGRRRRGRGGHAQRRDAAETPNNRIHNCFAAGGRRTERGNGEGLAQRPTDSVKPDTTLVRRAHAEWSGCVYEEMVAALAQAKEIGVLLVIAQSAACGCVCACVGYVDGRRCCLLACVMDILPARLVQNI